MELCMTQKEFEELAKSHSKWVWSEGKEGKRLELEDEDLSKIDFGRGYYFKGAVFSKCNFSGMTLRACFFPEAHFTNCNFDDTTIYYCTFTKADFTNVSFKNATIYASHFRFSNILKLDAEESKFIDCDFDGATILLTNFKNSILKSSSFFNTAIEQVDFYGTDFSGVKLVSSIDYVKKQFEQSKVGGFYAYKVFNYFRKVPSYWILEENQIISETVNYDRSLACGSGIHVGSFDYVKKMIKLNPAMKELKIWKVYIAPEWLPGVVVPFKADGDIRCEKCQLIEEYTYEELFGKEDE